MHARPGEAGGPPMFWNRVEKAMVFRAFVLGAALACSACSSEPSGPPEAAQTSDRESFLAAQAGFLASNAGRENVIVTDTGLQYEILTAGDGARPDADSTITVHYVGQLIDGTEFDSSRARGEPPTFALAGTIQGWVEGVQLMGVGAVHRLVIPAELAYADRGAAPSIEPGAVLVFEIELLEINSN